MTEEPEQSVTEQIRSIKQAMFKMAHGFIYDGVNKPDLNPPKSFFDDPEELEDHNPFKRD